MLWMRSSVLTPYSSTCSVRDSFSALCVLNSAPIFSRSMHTGKTRGSSIWVVPMLMMSLALTSFSFSRSPDGVEIHVFLLPSGCSRCNNASKFSLLLLSNSSIYNQWIIVSECPILKSRAFACDTCNLSNRTLVEETFSRDICWKWINDAH